MLYVTIRVDTYLINELKTHIIQWLMKKVITFSNLWNKKNAVIFKARLLIYLSKANLGVEILFGIALTYLIHKYEKNADKGLVFDQEYHFRLWYMIYSPSNHIFDTR